MKFFKKNPKLFALIFAVITIVSPIDIVPDVIPLVGLVDDIVAWLYSGYFLFSGIRNKLPGKN